MYTEVLEFVFKDFTISSPFLLRPGTMWAQQLLSQGLQSMGNSKEVQVVLMGLLSPHLTMDPHSQPIVLVSSSEVSNGKNGVAFLKAHR